MATYFCTMRTSSAASKYYYFFERNIILRGIFKVFGQIITDTHSTVNLNAYARTLSFSSTRLYKHACPRLEGSREQLRPQCEVKQQVLNITGPGSRLWSVSPFLAQVRTGHAGLPINTIYTQRCTTGTQMSTDAVMHAGVLSSIQPIMLYLDSGVRKILRSDAITTKTVCVCPCVQDTHTYTTLHATLYLLNFTQRTISLLKLRLQAGLQPQKKVNHIRRKSAVKNCKLSRLLGKSQSTIFFQVQTSTCPSQPRNLPCLVFESINTFLTYTCLQMASNILLLVHTLHHHHHPTTRELVWNKSVPSLFLC